MIILEIAVTSSIILAKVWRDALAFPESCTEDGFIPGGRRFQDEGNRQSGYYDPTMTEPGITA
jgi:hypothetical protein